GRAHSRLIEGCADDARARAGPAPGRSGAGLAGAEPRSVKRRHQRRAPLPCSIDLALAERAVAALDDELARLRDRAESGVLEELVDGAGCAARGPLDPRLERGRGGMVLRQRLEPGAQGRMRDIRRQRRLAVAA